MSNFQKAILVDKDSGKIIKHNTLVNADEPPKKLAPNLKYYIYYQPHEAPDYDPRYFTLNTIKDMKDGTPHPEFPDYDQYLISFSTTKRPNEDIKASVQNAENAANNEILPFPEQLKTIILAVGVLARQAEGQNLNPKEQKALNKAKRIAVRVWKNDAKRAEKEAEIEAGNEPDLDEGWESEKETD